MRTDHRFMPYAEIAFADGRTLSLGHGGDERLNITGNSYSELSDSTSFPLGVAIGRRISLSINNDRDDLWDYNFINAKIHLFAKYVMSTTTASIDFGVFTVIDPEAYGSTIELTAVDDMYKLDVEYTKRLSERATIHDYYIDICQTYLGAGKYDAGRFENDDYVCGEIPDGMTARQVIGCIAMFAGGNAIIGSDGVLRIKTYNLSSFARGLNGGAFDYHTPYMTGDEIDGGLFRPWNNGYDFDVEPFSGIVSIQTLDSHINLTLDTDDVLLSGVKMTEGNEDYFAGVDESYVLKLENQLVKDNRQAFLDRVWSTIAGISFRPFSADDTSNPLVEFMDTCYVADRKGNLYRTVVTDVDFNFLGVTTVKCAADSPIRNGSSYASQNSTAIARAKQEAEALVDEYEVASQNMMALISNGFGMYFTVEEQEDGTSKPYMHDQPTLAESLVVYEINSNGLQVKTRTSLSADWVISSGTTVNGDAIFKTITARGASVDWLRAKKINVGNNSSAAGVEGIYVYNGTKLIGQWDKNGITLFSGGTNGVAQKTSMQISTDGTATFDGNITARSLTLGTGVKISSSNINGYTDVSAYFDANGKLTVGTVPASNATTSTTKGFSVSKDGLLIASNALIFGTIYADSGKFGGELSAATGTFSGSISAATGTFTGGINSSSVTITGGSISIKDGTTENFSVTNKGVLTCKSASFTGSINSGSTITGSTIKGGTYYVGGGTNGGNATIHVQNSSGNDVVTIGGNPSNYAAIQLHSGNGIRMSEGSGIGGSAGAIMQILSGNANVTVNANNGQLHLGFQRTTDVYIDRHTYVHNFLEVTDYEQGEGGTILCRKLTETSDERFKNNIEEIDAEESLRYINALSPKKYNFRENPKIDRGLIAQDVLRVYGNTSDIVTENKNGYLSVSYNGVIADLVGSVQYLSQKIEALEAEIKALKGGD